MEKFFRPKLFDTLKTYTGQQFTNDVFAGIIVGVVALPLAIAFAIASGVTPEKRLITAVVAGFIIAVLGGSRVPIGGRPALLLLLFTVNDLVEKVKYQDHQVFINDTQYYDNVPLVAWEFYIGGYQPAQKWLRDRKGRELTFEDILHDQKIIVALKETDRIMKEINKMEM